MAIRLTLSDGPPTTSTSSAARALLVDEPP